MIIEEFILQCRVSILQLSDFKMELKESIFPVEINKP